MLLSFELLSFNLIFCYFTKWSSIAFCFWLIFGSFFRSILASFFLASGFLSSLLLAYSLLALVIVSCTTFRFFDIKKIIAFTSILHLNFTFVSLYSLSSIGLVCAIITSIAHAFSAVSLSLFAAFLRLYFFP